jgi:hypothetical protein
MQAGHIQIAAKVTKSRKGALDAIERGTSSFYLSPGRLAAAAGSSFNSLTAWAKAADRLNAARDSTQLRKDARALWLALPIGLIDAASAGACRDFLSLINTPVAKRAPWGQPPRRARCGSKWEGARRRTLDRLAALARQADTPAVAAFDRAAILRDAHKRFRDGKRLALGFSFSQCLTTAWAAARIKAQAAAEPIARAA